MVALAAGTNEVAMTTVPRRIHGYARSAAYSVGVEEEFQLLDPQTFELVPVVEGLLASIGDADRAQVKHELMQSVVETATTVCANVDAAVADLRRLRQLVIDRADQLGALVASAGTTPVSRWEDQVISDKPRYRELVQRLEWIARRELIFGLHVHVGMDCADKAMYVFNQLREELPLLLALSANSPFWQGSVTGLQSSRIKVFDAFPRSGMPSAFPGGWDEFEAVLARGAKTGLIPDHTYVWWDVRPHPEFGTIEVRICDAQTRLSDTAALTAVIQALAAWHGDRFEAGVRAAAPTPQLLIEENRWSAARHGLEGEMIDFADDTMVSTRHLIARMLDRIEPVSGRLGSREWFDRAAVMLDMSAADRQLDAWLAVGKDPRGAASMLTRSTAQDL